MQGKAFKILHPFGTYVILHVFFKIYAVERFATLVVEAALTVSQRLRKRKTALGLPIEQEISRIRIRTQRLVMVIINDEVSWSILVGQVNDRKSLPASKFLALSHSD